MLLASISLFKENAFYQKYICKTFKFHLELNISKNPLIKFKTSRRTLKKPICSFSQNLT